MTPFFRKIRRKLADDNKVLRYSRYAIGETLLIVVGILFALFIQNQNEKRKQTKQFEEVINKLYTTIKLNIESVYPIIEKGNEVIRIKNHMLDQLSKDSIAPWKLPHLLYRMEDKGGIHIVPNNTNYYSTLLSPNPESEIQNELTRLIVNFNTNLTNDFYEFNEISNYLKANDIPQYGTLGTPQLNKWESRDSLLYSQEEIQLTKELLNSKTLRAKLKNFHQPLQGEIAKALDLYHQGESILGLIKEFNPKAKLSFGKIGIIGTAIKGFEGNSIPMKRESDNKGIWEIDLYLKTGKVKFNSDNSWNNNWGGNEFPSGRILYWGGDISVTEGNYHIILNLEENSYKFIKLEE